MLGLPRTPGISIHAPRAGSDLKERSKYACQYGFQSTLPVRGATHHFPAVGQVAIFQSTLPVRGATGGQHFGPKAGQISIHAPRAGSDRRLRSCGNTPAYFNPRSPCGERRRRATDHRQADYFNPRSPCGERRLKALEDASSSIFQSTLPVRGATDAVSYELERQAFQSTLPVRGATELRASLYAEQRISIHAPRAGSDQGQRVRSRQECDFNPRSPCGERLASCCTRRSSRSFQSTLPVRGATCAATIPRSAYRRISIHAPRAGSDGGASPPYPDTDHFNPRSPCGERPVRRGLSVRSCQISIHAPRAGSDAWRPLKPVSTSYFNPRSPCGERRAGKLSNTRTLRFQSTLPVRGATALPEPQRRRKGISIHAPRAGSDTTDSEGYYTIV